MKELEKIVAKETKIQSIKEWLGILFFVVAAIVAIIIYATLASSIEGEVIGKKIIITLSAFAGLLIFGYFYDKLLSKRLEILWEQRKMLL